VENSEESVAKIKKTDLSPEDYLPLKPVDLLVLLVLLDGDLHGYGIVQSISTRSGGQIKLVPGNFYAILKRLMDSGLLGEAGERPSDDPGRPIRRYYRITALGKRVAASEARRLQAIVRDAEAKDLIETSEA